MDAPRKPTESDIRAVIRLNRILLTILVVTFASIFIGGAGLDPASPDVLRARRIELVDQSDRVVARLAIQYGSAGLFVHDRKGKLRASLVQNKDETGLFLRDSTGTIRVGAAQFAHGGGGFALHGAESKGAAVLYLKNTGSLTFYDRSGKATKKISDRG